MAQCISVVDDDATVRDSLRILLEQAGYDVAVFSSAEEFLSSNNTNRDCVITDVCMPGLSGLELQVELARCHADLPVILMTGYAEIPLAISAMKAGAIDFLQKPIESAHLLKSVARALEARRHVQCCVAEVNRARELLARLTLREQEVVTKLAHGLSNKEIAMELGISPRTVEIHRASIMDKLVVRNLTEITRIYLTAA